MAIYSTFRGLQANPKVQIDVLDELLYADDMNKNASLEAKVFKNVKEICILYVILHNWILSEQPVSESRSMH